jgi:phosphate transport system ATP-binding protein
MNKSMAESQFEPETHRQAPPGLRVEGLTVRFGQKTAVAGADLAVKSGQILAMVGPSGCGKSTLLASINGITDLVPGVVISGQRLLGDQPIETIVPGVLRRRVGMLFQKPNPFPMSIIENLEFPLREHGVKGRSQRREQAREALEQVGLWDEVKDRLKDPALNLSGGQQQRLCLARTLVLKPDVLLLDEPCSALDPIASAKVEACIDSLRGRYTIVIVTHNLAQARRISDEMVVFWVENDVGRIIEAGPTERLFIEPEHPTTRAYCEGLAG